MAEISVAACFSACIPAQPRQTEHYSVSKSRNSELSYHSRGPAQAHSWLTLVVGAQDQSQPIQKLELKTWIDLLAVELSVPQVGLCLMSCRNLCDVLATECLWQQLYLCHVAPRCGVPPGGCASWRMLCRRRWLQGMQITVSCRVQCL